uniref:Fe2OG dioxygenase domain-containing protein n=2 Tax=Solanum tuberosum TaxID=4113 RepID=M1C480_SOLTU
MKFAPQLGNSQGYGQAIVGEGVNSDHVERFYMNSYPINTRQPHLLPKLPPSLRESLEAYLEELEKLAISLLGCLAKTLKIDREVMLKMYEKGMQSVRMNYYPPYSKPELVTGLGTHSDGSAITIVHQVDGVDGLQVKQDGVWIPVEFIPNAFVVNIGDILEIWSNGVYKSPEHKVTVNEHTRRISIGVFFMPKQEAEIGPAHSLINSTNPALFTSVTMDKYLKEFFSRKLAVKTYLDHMKINKF